MDYETDINPKDRPCRLMRCENGHFFDKSRYDTCPICQSKGMTSDTEDFQKTIAKASGLDDSPLFEGNNLTVMYEDISGDMEKTIGLVSPGGDGWLVTGWLVVHKGKDRGKSFPLHMGKNTVGRSMKMDVALTGEDRMSRENHFSIVFEDKECTFYIVEGTASVELNGKLVSGFEKIKEGDVISASGVELIFIPYCKKGRQWHEDQNEK